MKNQNVTDPLLQQIMYIWKGGGGEELKTKVIDDQRYQLKSGKYYSAKLHIQTQLLIIKNLYQKPNKNII